MTKTVLCVDLDGTLIKGDVSFLTFFLLLRKNPFLLLPALGWLRKGKVHLKREIATRIAIDPAKLAYRDEVLAFLREERASGRKVVLATASDQHYAEVIAKHVGLFDEAIGSDGVINLSASRKRAALEKRYGRFAYMGNSRDDLAVWEGADEAIAVGTPPHVLAQLKAFKTPSRIFS